MDAPGMHAGPRPSVAGMVTTASVRGSPLIAPRQRRRHVSCAFGYRVITGSRVDRGAACCDGWASCGVEPPTADHNKKENSMHRPAALALAMLFALPAQAVEWTDHAPSAQRPGDASGLSALPLGNGGFLLRGPGATQWYDADGQFVRSGQPLLLTGAPLGTAPDGVALRAIQPLFEVPPLAPDCSFARLDGAHDVRELSHRFRSAEPNPADPAAAHYAWRRGEAPALVRVDADCQSAVVPVPLRHGLSVANAQDAPGAYVLGTAEIGSAREAQPADVALPVEHRLLRIAPGGEVLWTVVLPGPVTHMALAPQGDGVVLAGASDRKSVV